VVTFTLLDHKLAVNAGVSLGQIERALEARREDDADVLPPQTWFKSAAVSMLERVTKPINVRDVKATLDDGGVRLTAWVRAGGLRLTPVVFDVQQVDNREAAQAFVDELGRRQESAQDPSRLPGLLDYWAVWLVSGVLALGMLATRPWNE
jgi:hypothetical protein